MLRPAKVLGDMAAVWQCRDSRLVSLRRCTVRRGGCPAKVLADLPPIPQRCHIERDQRDNLRARPNPALRLPLEIRRPNSVSPDVIRVLAPSPGRTFRPRFRPRLRFRPRTIPVDGLHARPVRPLRVPWFPTSSNLLSYFADFLPSAASQLFDGIVDELAKNSDGGKVTFGIVAGVWFASGGMSSMISTLNAVFRVREARSWFRMRAIALALTLAMAILLLSALLMVFVGNQVVDWFAAEFSLEFVPRGRVEGLPMARGRDFRPDVVLTGLLCRAEPGGYHAATGLLPVLFSVCCSGWRRRWVCASICIFSIPTAPRTDRSAP